MIRKIRKASHVRNNRVKRHENPLIVECLNKKKIPHDEYVAGYFEAFCMPRTQEFVLLTFLKYPIDTTDDGIREILSNDKSFVEALKEFKDSFDIRFEGLHHILILCLRISISFDSFKIWSDNATIA